MPTWGFRWPIDAGHVRVQVHDRSVVTNFRALNEP